jgi:hypothetical protein
MQLCHARCENIIIPIIALSKRGHEKKKTDERPERVGKLHCQQKGKRRKIYAHK